MKTIQERHEIADEMRERQREGYGFAGNNIASELGIDISDYDDPYEFHYDAWEALIEVVEPYAFYSDMNCFFLPKPKEELFSMSKAELGNDFTFTVGMEPIQDAIDRWNKNINDEVCQMLFETFCRETCRWELVKSGATYDVYRCSRCGYEHVENKCDAGATELEPEFCPNCGAKVANDA